MTKMLSCSLAKRKTKTVKEVMREDGTRVIHVRHVMAKGEGEIGDLIRRIGGMLEMIRKEGQKGVWGEILSEMKEVNIQTEKKTLKGIEEIGKIRDE